MKPKVAVVVAVVFVVAVIAMVFVSQTFGNTYHFQGSRIDPPIEAADFTLTRANGEDFQLSEQRGKVVLLFFGYTFCPDVCPTTLAEYKLIYEELGEAAEQVEFVYVTVDPERDTPEVIDRYARAFNPEFIGLSGEESELQPIYDRYGVFREIQEAQASGSYLVAHTSIVYVIDKDGNWRLTFPFEMGPYDMADDVLYLVNEQE